MRCGDADGGVEENWAWVLGLPNKFSYGSPPDKIEVQGLMVVCVFPSEKRVGGGGKGTGRVRLGDQWIYRRAQTGLIVDILSASLGHTAR